MPDSLSHAAKDFITLCFNRVPRERPNATRLLQHPWLCSVQVPRAAPSNPLPMIVPPAPNTAATAASYSASAGAGPSQPPLQKQAAAQQQPSQHHQHLPPDLRAPPSPIKEESDSRYDSPMGGGTNASTPSTARTAVLNAASALVSPPHRTPGSAARPPMVPPLPLNLLNGSQQQPVLPKPLAAQQQPKAQYPAVSAPAPQQLQQQFDTLVDPDTVRLQMAQMQAAKQLPPAPQPVPASAPVPALPTMHHQAAPGMHDSICMGEGMTISMGPTGGCYDPAMQQYQSHVGGGSSAACRASTMTLSGYNPIEEPSWMPQPHDQAQRVSSD